MALSLAAALYFFYLKYVPLVKSFQACLLPVLCFTLLLTSIKARWGTFFFVFSFPLVNSLPYFFGIYENIPHAPTALVLFLFYLLGWLAHQALFTPKLSLKSSLSVPLALFSLMVLLSAVITFLRYANFFPFLADNIYELSTNVHGVTAGGAIMSVVFLSLNYLTGFAFFFILLNTVDSREYIKKILIVLLTSTSLALVIGSFQHLHDASFGNTPLRINEALINATFKNPLSFGAYLTLLIPVVLAAMLAFKGVIRAFSLLLFFWALFILPQTGSKSGLAGAYLSLFLFLILTLGKGKIWKRLKTVFRKRGIVALILLVFVVACLFAIWTSFRNSEAYKRLTEVRYPYGGLEEAFRIRWYSQWRMAALMMKDYPFSGVGVGAYIVELPNYTKIYQSPYKKWTDSAENYFLQVGSELGLFALVLSLWIFWEIFKKIRENLGSFSYHNRWKYIQIGISCSLIMLFLHFFVHTYIGSFEVKYTFWLLVGLLFCLRRLNDGEEVRILSRRKTRILFVLILAFFLGSHIWNSTHSLSLESRTEKLNISHNFGFYKEERTEDGGPFRWTKRNAGMTLRIEKPVMEICLLASHPDIATNPVGVEILLVKDFFKEKKVLAEIILREAGWKDFAFSIPEEVSNNVILIFKISRTWNPLKTRGVPDPRNLGIAIRDIQFRDSPLSIP